MWTNKKYSGKIWGSWAKLWKTKKYCDRAQKQLNLSINYTAIVYKIMWLIERTRIFM